MKSVWLLFFVLSVICPVFAQNKEEYLFSKLDKNQVKLNNDENLKLRRIVGNEINKKTHELIMINDLAGLKYRETFRASLDSTHDIVFSLQKREINLVGNEFFVFKSGKADYAVLVKNNNVFSAFINIGDAKYNIEPIDGKYYVLTQVDNEKSNSLASEEYDCPTNNSYANNKVVLKKNNSINKISTNYTVNVLVAYTQAVVNVKGSVAAVENFIDEARIQANYTYSNSELNIALNVVCKVLVNYPESGNLTTDKDRFKFSNDGFMDEIHTLRMQYGADICVLLVSTSTDGNAGLSDGPVELGYQPFCVVRQDYAINEITFTHEIGHSQGAGHQFFGPTPPQGEYAFGWWYEDPNPSQSWRTIMSIKASYGGKWGTDIQDRIAYWSDPSNSYLSHSLGTNNANNRLKLVNTAANIAALVSDPLTVSGTISSNTTWSGNVNVAGSVTVSSGVTLTISSGTNVYFVNGASLTINGILNATSSYFTSAYTWGGIVFNSGSSGNLNGCTINNVQTYGGAAIVINGPSPTIQNCTIENNIGATSGIQILSNGQPYIYNNIIRNNPEHGIYISHSNPYIRYNMITGSTSAGKASIYCYNFATPLLGGVGGGTSEGKNTLQNGYYGIAADYYSTPSAGGSDVAYNNRFINNTYANAYANYYSTIYARYDWWGSSTPDPNKIIAVIGSTIYWNPYLTSDPGPSRSMLSSPNLNDEVLATGLSLSISNSGSLNNNEIQQSVVFDDLLKARELRFTRNYQEAVNIYKSILASKGETSEAKIALVELGNTYAETKDVQILAFIKGFVQMKNDLYGLKPIAMEVLSKIYTSENSINEAIEINNKLINDYHGTVHERSGGMNLFFIYYNTGKYDLAKEMLSSVKVNFERNDEIAAAEWLMSSVGFMPIVLNKQTKKIDNELLITDFSIEQNYPNPFNPTTKIIFSLPQKSQIKLKVFDVLGREVANLADGVYEVGKYEVTFDASKLPSGVYFYNLTTGSNSISKKMLLVK